MGMQAVCKIQVRHRRGLVDISFLVLKDDLGGGYLHFRHLVILCHRDKGVVIGLRDLRMLQIGHYKAVENDHDHHDQQHICDQLFSGLFHFIHIDLLTPFRRIFSSLFRPVSKSEENTAMYIPLPFLYY